MMLNRRFKMQWLIYAVAMVLMAAPAQAETRRGVAVAAPTKPVGAKNLEAPVFQSDTRALQAIIDKDPEEGEPLPPAAAPAKTVLPAVRQPMITQVIPITAPKGNEAGQPEDERGMIAKALTSVRVFAIRWREVFDIVFALAIIMYVRKLYVLARDQYKFMAHCVRASEDAALSARRSAEIAQALLHSQQQHDEAQGKLDLR